MSYFNTTNESGTTLKNNVAKAKSQEEEIFEIFTKYLCKYKIKKKMKYFQIESTPSSIKTCFPNYPITSIRRALTNLTKQGKLIKTNEKRIGIYGRSEYVWKLNENTCESN